MNQVTIFNPKVKTRKDVDAIYEARKEVVRLEALYIRYIRDGNQEEAAGMRREVNRIKGQIKQKFDIIL